MTDSGLDALTHAQLVAARDAYLAGGDAVSASLLTSELNKKYLRLLGVAALASFVLWRVLK